MASGATAPWRTMTGSGPVRSRTVDGTPDRKAPPSSPRGRPARRSTRSPICSHRVGLQRARPVVCTSTAGAPDRPAAAGEPLALVPVMSRRTQAGSLAARSPWAPGGRAPARPPLLLPRLRCRAPRRSGAVRASASPARRRRQGSAPSLARPRSTGTAAGPSTFLSASSSGSRAIPLVRGRPLTSNTLPTAAASRAKMYREPRVRDEWPYTVSVLGMAATPPFEPLGLLPPRRPDSWRGRVMRFRVH